MSVKNVLDNTYPVSGSSTGTQTETVPVTFGNRIEDIVISLKVAKSGKFVVLEIPKFQGVRAGSLDASLLVSSTDLPEKYRPIYDVLTTDVIISNGTDKKQGKVRTGPSGKISIGGYSKGELSPDFIPPIYGTFVLEQIVTIKYYKLTKMILF